jgi:multimeric flavodoxin WrbA
LITKKLLGIAASERSWGNCEIAVKSVLAAACEVGGEAEFLRLGDYRVEPCKGCFTCVTRGSCRIADDLEDLLGRTASADCLVLASPVYFMAPPALLVGLLDRLLVMSRRSRPEGAARPAVTFTMMGNWKWRGTAQPIVNMTASLLGFDTVRSVAVVAEGPGEALGDPARVGEMAALGRALARGEDFPGPGAQDPCCPVCGSDFFRIDPPAVECPVCGSAGELDVLTRGHRFKSSGEGARWGLEWLERHVESWIVPSIERYRDERKAILRRVRALKDHYARTCERGTSDV